MPRRPLYVFRGGALRSPRPRLHGRTARAALLSVLSLGVLAGGIPGASAADTATNGVFRFLTLSVPVGSTNAEYVARLITANADGAVTYSVDPAKPLPAGLVIDPRTGLVTGRPTATFNSAVGFRATDGVTTIQRDANFKVNASGGGGNAGSTFTNVILPDARVPIPYAHTFGLQNGAGPFVYGAAALPPGLRLDGATGTVSGIPATAGTYFVSLSVTDHGENENKVVTVQPLTVLPAASDFRFTSLIANNGEVGTPFCDVWTTSGATGPVTFSATGLPPGLSVEPSTGVVGGTPTEAGTFTVNAIARDGTDTLTMNLTMLIAPSATSSLIWDFSGLPVALTGTAYDRQPPILVAAQNGTTLTYAASGLPAGIVYSTTTGELTGVTSEIGEHAVVFTATDTTTGDVIRLPVDFVVLPPGGGDAGDLAVNLWISKEKLKVGVPGKDTWSGSCVFNVDRRAANRFDPATDEVVVGVGSRTLTVPAASLKGTVRNFTYSVKPAGAAAEKVALSLSKQTLSWSTRNDTLTDVLPILARHTVVAGRGYRLDAYVGADGKLKPPTAFARKALVATSAAVTVAGAAKDKFALAMLFADPGFEYVPAATTLRLRVLDGTTVLLDRDFTALGTDRVTTDRATGATYHDVRTTADASDTNRVAKFAYSTKTGKLTAKFDRLTVPLTAAEAHVVVELTIGTRVAVTGVTLFQGKPGKYSTNL